jgi:hypothetical protein
MSNNFNLPWTYDLNRQVILDCNGDDVGGLVQASFDVAAITAVNSHEAMREALVQISKGRTSLAFDIPSQWKSQIDDFSSIASAALALSEVK